MKQKMILLISVFIVSILPLSVDIANAQTASWDSINTITFPQPRYRFGMAYDDNRGVVVLFGGRQSNPTSRLFNDTWEFDGNYWINKSPTQSPCKRDRTAMVYDKDRGVIVLFGGVESGDFDDTWEYNGTVWNEITPVTSPPSRFGHAMAYDEARKVTVLFGGLTSTTPPGVSDNDTWEYNGSTWVQINTANSPPARSWHSMVYDSNRNVTILFGGREDETFRDTWEYDGSDWVKVNTSIAPETGTLGAGMCYDTKRGLTVYFREYTWEYDGSNWSFVPIAILPEPRYEHELAYDSKRNKVVLFGGHSNIDYRDLNDTWELSVPSINNPPKIINISDFSFVAPYIIDLDTCVIDEEDDPKSMLWNISPENPNLVIQLLKNIAIFTNSDKFWSGTTKVYFKVTDTHGESDSLEIMVTVNTPTSTNEIESSIPNKFILEQNYPNPFNTKTVILFGLPKHTEVRVSVYNLNGQLVKELFKGKKRVGYHYIVWDASDFPSGTYLISMQAGNFVQSRKCVFLK